MFGFLNVLFYKFRDGDGLVVSEDDGYEFWVISFLYFLIFFFVGFFGV